MLNEPKCAVFKLKDEVIGATIDVVPGALDSCSVRKVFVSSIQFKFPLGLLARERHGRVSK